MAEIDKESRQDQVRPKTDTPDSLGTRNPGKEEFKDVDRESCDPANDARLKMSLVYAHIKEGRVENQPNERP